MNDTDRDINAHTGPVTTPYDHDGTEDLNDPLAARKDAQREKLHDSLVHAVQQAIVARFDVPATFEYPGFIAIPESCVNDDLDGSTNVWTVGQDGDEWTGSLMVEDQSQQAPSGLAFAFALSTTDPNAIADAVYVHGIGDNYIGGGCTDDTCPRKPPMADDELTEKIAALLRHLGYHDATGENTGGNIYCVLVPIHNTDVTWYFGMANENWGGQLTDNEAGDYLDQSIETDVPADSQDVQRIAKALAAAIEKWRTEQTTPA